MNISVLRGRSGNMFSYSIGIVEIHNNVFLWTKYVFKFCTISRRELGNFGQTIQI